MYQKDIETPEGESVCAMIEYNPDQAWTLG